MKEWTKEDIDSVCELVGGNVEEIIRQLQSRLESLEKDAARYVMVDRGALQMVLNALERDAQEGKVSRGEMRQELIKSMQANKGERYGKRFRPNTHSGRSTCLLSKIGSV